MILYMLVISFVLFYTHLSLIIQPQGYERGKNMNIELFSTKTAENRMKCRGIQFCNCFFLNRVILYGNFIAWFDKHLSICFIHQLIDI